MSHWQDEHELLNVSCKPAQCTELWHGERWHDLSYFWDPSIEVLM